MARKPGSKAKLREHFLANIGRVMDADELRGIAGANEYGRRIRELRNEEGFLILTHNDRSDLKPGEYVLSSPKPQPAFAREVSTCGSASSPIPRFSHIRFSMIARQVKEFEMF